MKSPRQEKANETFNSSDAVELASISEKILFWLAKRLYRTECAQSAEMKSALTDPDKFIEYRVSQINRIQDAASRHHFDPSGGTLLDLGCHDGSLTRQFLSFGARSVIGIDIDVEAVARARLTRSPGLEYLEFDGQTIPLPDASIDSIISYDVFEHIVNPLHVLRECRRVLKSGGKMLIGTWGWRHPFAPHLWALMPVPWAHLFVSDQKLLRICRRVYQAPWYVPTMFDFDEQGERYPDRFTENAIPREYLNRYLISDFVRDFRKSNFQYSIHLEPFGIRFAKLSRPLLRVPWLREVLHGYMWAILTD